jgi:hypothetical protein
VAKKLKKKQRPLSFQEWGETTGATVAAVRVIGELEDGASDKVHAIASDSDVRRVAKRMSDAHHEYLCAFISNLLEAKR